MSKATVNYFINLLHRSEILMVMPSVRRPFLSQRGCSIGEVIIDVANGCQFNCKLLPYETSV